MLQVLSFVSQRSVPRSILVVDDEEDIRDAVRDVLESYLEEARILTADSGRAALEILKHEHVDLIITDYKMPGMSGVQLLGAAEVVVPGVRHILITAFDRDLVQELGTRAKGERIVQKPLEPHSLIKEVERALGK